MDQDEVLRLNALSPRQLMVDELQQRYGLSTIEAEVLYDRMTIFAQSTHPDSREDLRVIMTAVAKRELAIE